MRKIGILLLSLGIAASIRADETISSAQQTLKDQGFYYGEITGQKDADTSAAIRRYQIRNGLKVTGDLNDETLRSLRTAPSPPPQFSPPPATTHMPSPTPDTSDLRDESSREPNMEAPPVPARPFVPPQDRQYPPDNSAVVVPSSSDLFAGTPYEGSPPDVQRSMLVALQQALAAREVYRGDINGVYGPNVEFSLRAYQSRVGLPVTGRPDLGTLAALELLPGAKMQVYRPRKWWQRPQRLVEPPVRGEWVRP